MAIADVYANGMGVQSASGGINTGAGASSQGNINNMEQEVTSLLSGGNVLLAIAYIYAVLQLQDQNKLGNTAKELNKAAKENSKENDYVTMLQNLINQLEEKQSKDNPDPKVSDSADKNDQSILDKLNQFLKSEHLPTLTMDQFNNLDLKKVEQYEAKAKTGENNSGALKNSLQTQVQMQESEFQTVTQYFSSVISSLKNLSNQIASAIGR